MALWDPLFYCFILKNNFGQNFDYLSNLYKEPVWYFDNLIMFIFCCLFHWSPLLNLNLLCHFTPLPPVALIKCITLFFLSSLSPFSLSPLFLLMRCYLHTVMWANLKYSSRSFYICVHLHNHYVGQNVEHSQHIKMHLVNTPSTVTIIWNSKSKD